MLVANCNGCLYIIPICSGRVGILVFSTITVGVTVAVVNIAVVAITEGDVAIILVISGAMDVSISVIIIEVGVTISAVDSGNTVDETVDVGEIVTSTTVSFVQVHLLRLFCDMSFDKLSSTSSANKE